MIIARIKKIMRVKPAVPRTSENPDFNRQRETRRKLAYLLKNKS